VSYIQMVHYNLCVSTVTILRV